MKRLSPLLLVAVAAAAVVALIRKSEVPEPDGVWNPVSPQ